MGKTYSRAYVEITNICNMNCSFCHGHSRAPRRMSYEEFDKLTNDLSGVTQYIYYHLMGEPLTHPSLPDFLDMAAEQGFRSIITTNGTRLAEVGERLPAHGVHKVSISLHSFEGDIKEKHIQYIKKCADFADKASKYGVLTVFRLWNKGYDEGRNDITLSILHECFPSEWCENERGARIRHKFHLEWGERFDWPTMDIPPIGDRVFCYGLGDHFGILSDGTVIPCCLDREGDIALGNAFDGDLCEILSSERAENIRDGFARREAREELCKRCGYARRFKI